jgi:putative sigma-54 modulation protein
MKVDITGRHIEITEPLRKFVMDRIDRMHDSVTDVLEVHVVLTVEKHQRHMAEANIKTRNDFHHVQETSTDMYTSIAAIFDRVDKQILRAKDKTVTRKRHGAAEREVETAEPEV